MASDEPAPATDAVADGRDAAASGGAAGPDDDDGAPAAYSAAHPDGLGFTGAHLVAHWDTLNDYAHIHPGSKPSGYDLSHAYPGYHGAHCHPAARTNGAG